MKLPFATLRDAIESIESSHVGVQRKSGRPRKAEKVEFLAEKEQKTLELTESGETTSPTFARFQELPEELRIKIWKLTLPGPRLVEVSFATPKHLFSNSHRSTPSILHVCSESRKEALKCYTVCPLGLDFDPLRAVYVNFQIDTLYFSDDAFGTMYSGEAGYGLSIRRIQQLMNRVRFIAIGHTAIDRSPRHGTHTVEFLHQFCKLEELTVVASDVRIGEITDKHKLDVWDEWQIGEVTCKYQQDLSEWDRLDRGLNDMYDLWCFERALAGQIPIQVDQNTKRHVALMIKWAMTMTTMDSGVLKDVKARIVEIDRAGLHKDLEKERRVSKRKGFGTHQIEEINYKPYQKSRNSLEKIRV